MFPIPTRTKVVNVKTDEFDVYIGRKMPGYPESPFHNPVRLVPGMTREECIEKLRKVWAEQPELVDRMRAELDGKRIGCWCNPLLCHGHLIVELIEGVTIEQQLPPRPEKLQQSLF